MLQHNRITVSGDGQVKCSCHRWPSECNVSYRARHVPSTNWSTALLSGSGILKFPEARSHAKPQFDCVNLPVKRRRSPVTETIHRHALNQMALAVDMPMKFLDSLAEEKAAWGKELLAHNLKYHLPRAVCRGKR